MYKAKKVEKEKLQLIARIIIVIICMILSFLVFRPMLTNPEFYSTTITELDREKSQVTQLLAGSTAASLVVTVLPGDIGTPIAGQLANLSTIFIFILSVLYAEKYLLTIFGFIASVVVFPMMCILYLLWSYTNDQRFAQTIKKLLILLVAILVIVPMGAKVSVAINNTYGASINAVINTAVEPEIPDEDITQTEEKGWFERASDWVTNTASSVGVAATESVEWAKQVLNNFIEATAVMLVTCCVIPIVVFWLFITFLNKVFNKNFVPVFKNIGEKTNMQIRKITEHHNEN